MTLVLNLVACSLVVFTCIHNSCWTLPAVKVVVDRLVVDFHESPNSEVNLIPIADPIRPDRYRPESDFL